MAMTTLQPIPPTDAKAMYLTERESSLAPETIQTQDYTLRRFVEWCGHEGIGTMDELDGRSLHEYRLSRADDGLTPWSLKSQLSTVRVFIRFCESIDAVENGLAEKMIVPSADTKSRDEMLTPETAEQVLGYLRKFGYGTRDHAITEVLWHTGVRMGTLWSFDVEDFDRDGQCLAARHRPNEGTTLKNGDDAERLIALDGERTQILSDYVEHTRIDVTDDYGRNPLFTTENGRISKTTLRRTSYRVTRPCFYTGECPHERTTETCDAATDNSCMAQCPSSVSCHPIRGGSITYHLLDNPENVVTTRCNVSASIIDDFYDRRDEEQRMERRRDVLNL